MQVGYGSRIEESDSPCGGSRALKRSSAAKQAKLCYCKRVKRKLRTHSGRLQSGRQIDRACERARPGTYLSRSNPSISYKQQPRESQTGGCMPRAATSQ